MFLLLLFSQSTKNAEPYLLCMQASAGTPQAPDRILCKRIREEGRSRVLKADTERYWNSVSISTGHRFCGKSDGIPVGSGLRQVAQKAPAKKKPPTPGAGGLTRML